MPLFRREAKISKVEPVKVEQPREQPAQSPPPIPLPPPTDLKAQTKRSLKL